MIAATVAVPQIWETFLFVPPVWPISSGTLISLDVCNGNWERAGYLVRVDHNVKTLPQQSQKDDRLVTYEIGGPGARVYVSGPFPIGYPAYRADDPREWTFEMVKMVGGVAANPGTPINNGDQVSLRIDSGYRSFYFRVIAGHNGAEVHGDGTALSQAGTVFTVEFNEVRSGLGWRPSVIRCQSCAKVTARVTRASTGNPISGATVVAHVPNHPFNGITGSDGRAVLSAFVNGANRNCIPAGHVNLVASANRHQTRTVAAAVPDTGSIEVPIPLDCTQVKGVVVDTAGNPVPGKWVYLRDQAGGVILDENQQPYRVQTMADGTFTFNCVAHEWVQVWTTADPSQTQHTKVVPPEGWTNVKIVVQTSCGNLVGKVTDSQTGQAISGATVVESGGRQTTTDANGCFTFVCIKPAGNREVFASAPGYSEEFVSVLVPATGNFDCQNPPPDPVHIQLRRIMAMEFHIQLDWGMQPSDLDSHLSGPDPAGGRFHLFYANRSQPPVPFAGLDLDDTTALGPETMTIRRASSGLFVAGDYRYWVHNYSATYNPTASFVGSGAAVSVLTVDAQGILSQIGRFEVLNATGVQDDIWHVFVLTLDVNGNFVLSGVQAFQHGDQNTVL